MGGRTGVIGGPPPLSSGVFGQDPSPPAADWPANANGDLPLGGVFYGNPTTGVGLQNAAIAIETSRRFRAERSGTLAYTSYNNRTLNMFNITDRCKRLGGVWCDCVNNNLDQYTCGYILGSSYSVGNGGNIHVELRTNTANGTPTTTGARGPYFGDNSATVFSRRYADSGWSLYKDNISWYDVSYIQMVLELVMLIILFT